MTTQHTQGPWHVTTNQHGHWIYDKKGYLVSNASGNIYETNAAIEANARLIAAAPDLLEALLLCECEISMHKGLAWSNAEAVNDAIAKARTAIAKAKGK